MKAEIINSTFYLNGEGIFVDDSKNLILDGCEFCHNGIGANIQRSSAIQIRLCQAHENGIGMLCNTSQNVSFTSTAFYDNNDNQGGCFISNSQDFSFLYCTIQHNGFGLRIGNSTNICFDQCTIRYNTHFSFYVEKQSDIKIQRSNIENNRRYGVYLYDSSCVLLDCNLINNSIDGVHLTNSDCDARNNYWGSSIGPFFSEVRLVDRIMINTGILKMYPWKKQTIEGIGNGVIIEEQFTKTKILGYEDASLQLPGMDTDDDGAPDWWEELFGYNPMIVDDHYHLHPDDDAITNIYECYAYDLGADPFRKDVFLEFDWMPGLTDDIDNRPPETYISQIIQRFEDHDISLHIDTGENNGEGSEIPLINNFEFDVLRDLYWEYFLENNLYNPRKYIFHYGLICNTGPGNGFAFIGWGQLNAFCISADVLQKNNLFGDRGHLISSGSMHELGHNLGLLVDDVGGNDNTATTRPWYKEYYEYWNYKSCMNYRYTYQILDFSDGQHGENDYNDWDNLEYDFFIATSFDLPARFG
jgi:parallel beta-helix repeat protein